MKFESKRQQAMVLLGLMAGFMDMYPNGPPPVIATVITDDVLKAMDSFGREHLVVTGNEAVDPVEYAQLMVAVLKGEVE